MRNKNGSMRELIDRGLAERENLNCSETDSAVSTLTEAMVMGQTIVEYREGGLKEQVSECWQLRR